MYYFWRLLGYEPEECVYRTEAEFLKLVDKIEQKRQKVKEEARKTRSYSAKVKNMGESCVLNTKFHTDLKNEIKSRWQGIKGLDAEGYHSYPDRIG
jgi:hypothetical protein|tara:strand:- start:370 stop:657 length:288 start_codon:yes stop_codon:yes gene_type:complete